MKVLDLKIFIEAKLSQKERSKGLFYLKSKFPEVRAVQTYLKGNKEFINGAMIEHLNCLKFLKEF